MSFFLNLLKKELEDMVKEMISPVEELEKLYTFKPAKDLDSKAHLVAKMLGVDEDEDLINAIRKALQGKGA